FPSTGTRLILSLPQPAVVTTKMPKLQSRTPNRLRDGAILGSIRTSIRAGDFVTPDGGQGTVGGQRDGILNEPHRAIRKGELQPARVAAVEGVRVWPVAGAVGRVIGRDGTGAIGPVGIDPGVPGDDRQVL